MKWLCTLQCRRFGCPIPDSSFRRASTAATGLVCQRPLGYGVKAVLSQQHIMLLQTILVQQFVESVKLFHVQISRILLDIVFVTGYMCGNIKNLQSATYMYILLYCTSMLLMCLYATSFTDPCSPDTLAHSRSTMCTN